MTNLTDLNYFLTVAKTSNISRAAELCGVSQPALSHALRRLEDELDTRLFIREKTGVQLTRAGQKFAVQCRELIDRWTALAHSVRSTDEVVSGNFTIGCHPSVAIYALPHFLNSLTEQYPELQITLKHALSREIAGDVISWRTEYGLVINPPKHPDLVIRELARDEVTFWVSTKCKTHDTLIYDPQLLQSQDLVRAIEKKRNHGFKRRIETSNLEVVRALTIAGCGVGVLPGRVVASQGGHGLKKFSADAPVVHDQLCLIYRAESQRHASGKAIVQAICSADI